MWAPDSPDGPGALRSCIEGLPGGGFCPWLRMQAAWGVPSETCCGCGGRVFPGDIEARADQAAGRAGARRARHHVS